MRIRRNDKIQSELRRLEEKAVTLRRLLEVLPEYNPTHPDDKRKRARAQQQLRGVATRMFRLRQGKLWES